MIETDVKLRDGEIISFDLPVVGPTEARVIWTRAPYHGCEFLTPVSTTAVGAALHQAAVDSPDTAPASIIEEFPVGLNPSVDELAKWKSEFEKTKGASGYQLVGFRQRFDGMIIAIVSKSN